MISEVNTDWLPAYLPSHRFDANFETKKTFPPTCFLPQTDPLVATNGLMKAADSYMHSSICLEPQTQS